MARQQRLGHRAGRHPGRGLAGRGPLEHVAGVDEVVLLHAGQVGVAGAGRGQRRGGGPGSGRHLLGPLAAGPLAVGDLDGHRRAEGAAVADAAQEGHLVLLEAHAGARGRSPGAGGPARPLDVLDGHRQPGGQALEDHHEGLAVGLAGGQEAQHRPNLLAGPPGTEAGLRRWPARPGRALRRPA